MKTENLIVIAIASQILLACVSVPTAIPSPTIAEEAATEIKAVPPIGEVNSVEIGDNLYSEFRLTTRQTFTVTVVAEAYGEMDLGNKIRIKEGTQGTLMKTWAYKYNALCFDFVTTGGISGASHACLVDKSASGVFDHAMFKNRDRYFPLLKRAKYTLVAKEKTIVEDAADFKRVVLYQGLSKGTIKVSFREFIKDMARPAFTQDVSYDLDQDGTAVIAFKGLRIQVLKASGANIRYKVLQPFSDSATSATSSK